MDGGVVCMAVHEGRWLIQGRAEGMQSGAADLRACAAMGFFFFFSWKEAYMPIDANHISNSKDR